MLLDNSAWSRLAHPGLVAARANEIADALGRGELVVSLPFLLEAGYSARDTAFCRQLLDELLTLPRVGVDEEVEDKALAAQLRLAEAGHRLPPVDLILAALADRHDLAILHYDGDYDLILERTDLRFESIWLAPRGSL
jgi:predicted nucleic acid-binding protein